MHYADGQEAHVGDLICTKNGAAATNAPETIGILTSASPGSTSCNGQMQPIARWLSNGIVLPLTGFDWCITIGQCLKVPTFAELLPKTPEAPPTTT